MGLLELGLHTIVMFIGTAVYATYALKQIKTDTPPKQSKKKVNFA
jgi:hypothetical protein